jgi:hypothetical protein
VEGNAVTVQPVGSSGVINSVVANGLVMTGPQLDLRNVDPALDETAATWSNGDWFASLVIQSDVAGRMRVCWNTYLPPPPPLVSDDPTYIPEVRTLPLRRLMCGIYSATQPGPDLGGHVVDDLGGTVSHGRVV